jgi:hypothetical protein
MRFVGSGNVSVGVVNGSVMISGGGGAGGGIVLRDGVNSITSGTASISGVNLTASVNGQTLSLSAPATSSFVAINGLSLSTNGSTVSLYPSNILDFYQNMDRGASSTLSVPYGATTGSLMLQRLNQENNDFAGYISANTVLVNMSATGAASTAHTITAYIGIYSDNTTALSIINSASSSWALAGNANNSLSYAGPRWLSFVSSQWSSAPNFSQGGEYVFGLFMRASGYAPPLGYIGQQYMNSVSRSGTLGGAAQSATSLNSSLAQGNYWNAVFTATSITAFPATIASNAVSRFGSHAAFMPHIILNNRYSGTF